MAVVVKTDVMGITKSEIYTTEQNELSIILKAIGHPARLAIIEQLLATKTCICGDFSREIGLAQPTISRHLKELKAVGIIQGTIEGTSVCYCINPLRWREIEEKLKGFFGRFAPESCKC